MENTIIDFLTPDVSVEDNQINTENSNSINTQTDTQTIDNAVVDNDTNTQTQFNFLDTDSNTNSKGSDKDVDKNIIVDKNTNNTNSQELINTSDYYTKFMELAESGLIDLENLPEDISTEPDSPTTAEDTLKAVLHNMEKRETSLLEYGQKALLGKLPEELQQAIIYANNEGDPIEYLKTTLISQEIKSLDPSNETHQEQIVREFYKSTDLSADDINEKITDLKDTDLLAKEALKLKPKLDKRADDIAKTKLESQTRIREQKEAVNKIASDRITGALVKGLGSIKFNQQEAIEFLNTLMGEQEFDYGTHKATKTGVEYLIDYHKYAKEGSPERVIKALMILDPKGRFDSKIENLYKKEFNDKFVSDHTINSKNKFKNTPNTNNQSGATNKNKPSNNKFKFITQ